MSLQISEEQARAINALAGGSSEIKEYCLSILANRKEPIEIESHEEFEEGYRQSLALLKGTIVNTRDKGSFVINEDSHVYAALKCVSVLGFNRLEAIEVLSMVSARTERELAAQ